MESRRQASAPSSACSVAFPRPDSPLQSASDSFGDSEHCSADPNAFLGFHVSPSAGNVDARVSKDLEPPQPQQQTLKLVLDLKATTGNVTRGGTSFNPFNELFAENTQDDETLITSNQMPRRDHVPENARGNVEEEHKSAQSPRLTTHQSMESTWRVRKQQVTEVEQAEIEEKQCNNDTMVASLEDSEDLAPRIFQTTFNASFNGSRGCANEKMVSTLRPEEHHHHLDVTVGSECCDQETNNEDEAECTQALDADVDASRKCEEATEVYSGTGTLPYRVDSACLEDEISRNEEKQATHGSGDDQEESVIGTRADEKNDQRRNEDEVTSRDGSQGTQQEYLTPRVNPLQAEELNNPTELTSRSDVVVDLTAKAEFKATTSQSDDEGDECVATQPSARRTNDDEPVHEPDALCHQQNVQTSDKGLATKLNSESNCQGKASRSLEFSFSMPESQEGDPRFSASYSSNDTPAGRSDPVNPFESSISPVCLATPTPTPANDSISSPIQEKVSLLQSSPPLGKPNTMRQVVSETVATPITKKRKRHSFSLVRDETSSKESHCGNSLTPRPPVRRNTRSTQSTPSSTPKRRTRTRILTPVPSHRAYVSRSRTLFKYKFEFCLTGFMKSGEESLKELIEGHGGKIPERYQDVLYPNNPKAVVIATPVSWRKRKFMQAVACGIPVVHTDWIKDCIEHGRVISFEGYQVPTGYSVTTRKFECLPPTKLHIFEGFSFGIASDVAHMSKTEAKDQANLMTFILKACGAEAVYENVSSKDAIDVQVVLCDEYTPTCRYYKRRRNVFVKSFRWVTECMILQHLLDPNGSDFEPMRADCEDVCSASAEIGDNDKTKLKLYTGELVMADIPAGAADHYLLFHVCEILSIHLSGRNEEGSQSKRKENKEGQVMLRVGMLRREPYNPELSKVPVKVLDISSSQVKRRVVAISKKQYCQLKYKDESIFYYEDEKKPTKFDASNHHWLTQ